MKYLALIALSVLLCSSCQKKDPLPSTEQDLTQLKEKFLNTITQSDVQEGPFSFNYTFRTVFFSKKLMSLLGHLSVHDRLPHGWQQYESKTYWMSEKGRHLLCLEDLFPTSEQKAFLVRYCEKKLRENPISYSSGEKPLKTTLNFDELNTFVVDEHYLMIVFQPYSVGGCCDGPIHVKISYQELEGHWSFPNPVIIAVKDALKSKEFTSSWDREEFYQKLADGYWD